MDSHSAGVQMVGTKKTNTHTQNIYMLMHTNTGRKENERLLKRAILSERV